MMQKQSNKKVPCTWCDKDALPNTDPPACADHLEHRPVADRCPGRLDKNASEPGDRLPDTLKELLC